ncbi:DUF4429 domain-containing protein [Vaginisenegalia massiliensis]|uniref:DUF4429 domain-containing protein n=1 Tax=Vaginisenegalia massiliensis TaxID=2058294 RepID=UPI000F527D5A|nr:DUF4429 domain-containing protein [Vaginisenegalia massiliensis]
MKKEYYIKSPGKTLIVIDNDKLTIQPKGLINTINKGLSGAKTIKIKNITSVQIKKPGFTQGYIQFGVIGDGNKQQGLFGAVYDENTVLFKKKYYKDMLEIKEYIDNYNEHSNSQSTSLSDELIKLAKLKESGIITETEFLDYKKNLMK